MNKIAILLIACSLPALLIAQDYDPGKEMQAASISQEGLFVPAARQGGWRALLVDANVSMNYSTSQETFRARADDVLRHGYDRHVYMGLEKAD